MKLYHFTRTRKHILDAASGIPFSVPVPPVPVVQDLLTPHGILPYMDLDSLITYMKYGHAAFNILVFVLFVYQGLLGLGIRKMRLSGKTDFALVRKHRRNGPLLALCGIAGFVAGPFLTLLDHGRIGVYPLHFLVGMIIVVAISLTFALSRAIRGPAEGIRTAHMRAGFALLSLYVLQIFLGTMIVLSR